MEEVRILDAFDSSFAPGGEWDELLAGSSANTVFLLSGWLRAWRETLAPDVALVIPQVRRRGRLIAAAAFQAQDGVLEFAGKGPSDYSDIVVSRCIERDSARHLIRTVLEAARSTTRGFRFARLARIPIGQSETPAVLLGAGTGLFASEERRHPAPAMEMSAVEEKLKKKSLRRHERAFSREGRLECETFREASRILPQLDDFFDQHVRRWNATEWPSQFRMDAQRLFYRRVTEHLDASGILRFTALRLDGRLVAAHYGFHHAGRFTWYKPTYDPDLARLSPGEVLIKRLLELARDEGADEFDFTIGDEPFKLRYATKTRELTDVHLARSRLRALATKARVRAREAGERFLGKKRFQALLRRAKRRIGTPP